VRQHRQSPPAGPSRAIVLKAQVDRQGLEMLRPREPPAADDAQPAAGADRAEDRGVQSWASGAWAAADRGQARSGAVGRADRLAQRGLQDAGSSRLEHPRQAPGVDRQLPRAPFEPPRDRVAEPHIDTSRPGELVGIDCFFVGHLRGSRGPVWQITAIDTYSSFAWADLVNCPDGAPGVKQTSKLARRVARELKAAGWKLERVLTDNGPEFGRRQFDALLPAGVGHTQTRSGRPQTNGHVERLSRTILEECWRPAFARYLYLRFGGLRRDLNAYLHDDNYDREHHGRITQGRVPAQLVYGARKMEPR